MRKLRFSFEYHSDVAARRSYMRELVIGILASIVAGLLLFYLLKTPAGPAAVTAPTQPVQTTAD